MKHTVLSEGTADIKARESKNKGDDVAEWKVKCKTSKCKSLSVCVCQSFRVQRRKPELLLVTIQTQERKVIIKGWKREKIQSHEDAALAAFPLVCTCGRGEARWQGSVCVWICRGWRCAVGLTAVRWQFCTDGFRCGRPPRHKVSRGAVNDGDVGHRLLPQRFLVILINEYHLGLHGAVKAKKPSAVAHVFHVLVAEEHHGNWVLYASLGLGSELIALVGWGAWLGCDGCRSGGHHT